MFGISLDLFDPEFMFESFFFWKKAELCFYEFSGVISILNLKTSSIPSHYHPHV